MGRKIPELAAAIEQHRGLVYQAAASVGITREALWQRIAKSEVLQAALATAKERQLDRTENQLFAQIDAGEAWAICFYLKTQGKARGYIETVRHEIDISASLRQMAEEAGLDPDEVLRDAEVLTIAAAR